LWLLPLCKTCLDPNGKFVSSVALSAISMPACSTLMTDDQCLRTRANTPCACRFCIVAIDARADSDLLILSFNGVLFNSPNRYGMMICIWATCWVTCSAKQFNRYCSVSSRMLMSWVEYLQVRHHVYGALCHVDCSWKVLLPELIPLALTLAYRWHLRTNLCAERSDHAA
jgi:hypothetical protein